MAGSEALRALRHRDPAAINRLVDAYGPALCRFLRNRVRDQALAEELLQEVWHQALRSHRRLRDPERFQAWLYGVARNIARSAMRRRGREISLSTSSQAEESPGWESSLVDESAADPRTEAVRRASLAKLRSLLGELDDGTREMITLRFFDGLTTGQIAKVLDVPLGTVCTKVHRGLRSLRTTLQREGLTLEDLT
jgi:RNA polymerase sigma-70 factor (ECF subfamily)